MDLYFKFEKETKGAVRYQEVDKDSGQPAFAPKVGTLYVRKSALTSSNIPQGVKMTLAFD